MSKVRAISTRPISAPRTINGDVSDLFFNTELDSARVYDHRGHFTGWDATRLEQEAMQFLASLGRLGVDTPTVDDLIADFHGRA
jgi:hypothetical protein